MNADQEAARDSQLAAMRERERLAMAATLAEARQAIGRRRMGAASGASLTALAVAVITWPFAHMKMK